MLEGLQDLLGQPCQRIWLQQLAEAMASSMSRDVQYVQLQSAAARGRKGSQPASPPTFLGRQGQRSELFERLYELQNGDLTLAAVLTGSRWEDLALIMRDGFSAVDNPVLSLVLCQRKQGSLRASTSVPHPSS